MRRATFVHHSDLFSVVERHDVPECPHCASAQVVPTLDLDVMKAVDTTCPKEAVKEAMVYVCHDCYRLFE